MAIPFGVTKLCMLESWTGNHSRKPFGKRGWQDAVELLALEAMLARLHPLVCVTGFTQQMTGYLVDLRWEPRSKGRCDISNTCAGQGIRAVHPLLVLGRRTGKF
jgi:hypothetical protein